MTDTPGAAQLDVQLDTESHSGIHILTVGGQIDAATSGQLERALTDAEPGVERGVVLDLSAVDFIDSTGLRVISRSIARLTADDRALAAVAPPGPVRRLVELTALTGHFRLSDSQDQAIGALPGG